MEMEEQIEAYLDNRLSPVARSRFEAQLAQNPDMQAELKLYQDTYEVLRLNRAATYKAELQNLEAERKSKVVAFPWTRWASLAAIVVVLLGLGYFLSRGINKDPYQAAFAPYPDRISMRGGEDDSLLQVSMQHYATGDFEEALTGLELLAQSRPEEAVLQFYLGSAYLGVGNPSAAIAPLRQVPIGSLYHSQAQWYLVLAFGQSQKVEESNKILRGILDNPSHPYHSDALNLREQIDQ